MESALIEETSSDACFAHAHQRLLRPNWTGNRLRFDFGTSALTKFTSIPNTLKLRFIQMKISHADAPQSDIHGPLSDLIRLVFHQSVIFAYG